MECNSTSCTPFLFALFLYVYLFPMAFSIRKQAIPDEISIG